MRHRRRAACALIALLAVATPAAAAPEGQVTWGVHISLAPTWFDQAETQGIITPFMVMYAMPDALVKGMPGNPTAPSLAESWQMSPDGRVYDFTLRKGVKFHNGDTLTSEDVKFSFERYKGASAKAIHDRVAAVETPGPLQVRFRLKNPWPDFMTFYTADRKSTRLNSSHLVISYAVFCLKKKKKKATPDQMITTLSGYAI